MFIIRILRPILHFLFICFIFYIVYNFRIITDGIPFIYLDIPHINFTETIIFGGFWAILFPLIWLIYGLYKLKWPIHEYYNWFLRVFIFWFVSITFIAYFWHEFIFKNWISRLIIIWSGLLVFFWLLFLDFIINLINSIFEARKPYRVWVYNYKYFDSIKDKFRKYKIYDIQNIKKYDDLQNVDILFLVWSINSKKIEELMDIARFKQIEVYHIPDVNFLEDILYYPERFGPIISWKYKASPLEWRWKISKRLFDIIFSLFFILLFFWVYILIIIWIYIHDRWNCIYVSKRIWQWGKPIKIYKFRTMFLDADKQKDNLKSERDGVLFKIKEDPRIPKWWKILRKTSLDEIPQFFNVLKWDMSIAWPRPHLKEEVVNYEKWQKRLLAAKPWITGYAQVFGRDLPFPEEARLDLYRFQNWSVWMDVVVILGVFRTIFRGS